MSYRHPRYHNQKTLLTPCETMAVFFGLIGLAVGALAIAGAVNSAPLTRKGQFCPIGYYRASAYCMPLQPTTPPAVPRTTENCPLGTYTQSNYCVSLERAE